MITTPSSMNYLLQKKKKKGSKTVIVFLLNVLNIYSQVFLFSRSCTNEQSGRRSIFFGILTIIFMHKLIY